MVCSICTVLRVGRAEGANRDLCIGEGKERAGGVRMDRVQPELIVSAP